MHFPHNDPESQFHDAWRSVSIERPVSYSLFTFGESDLPYFLIVDAEQPREPVNLIKGEVKITRPLIITPNNAQPELRGFFENHEFDDVVEFMLQRTAAFSHLKLDNRQGPAQIVSDSVEEVVARLNAQLDADEEDRVAILTAPYGLGGLALLRYATERVWQSAPDNIQELRERGFLPK
ncbi:MAG: hypothetical protein R3B91_12050 [Planctomycetaceae bacterium]|nr:hypothetical protein [Planctomycetaceae bacterium]